MTIKSPLFLALFLIGLMFVVSCNEDDDQDPCDSTVANAGEDQHVFATTTQLEGNAPDGGTGLWTIVSGEGGEFSDPTDPSTEFSGTLFSTYVLKWSIDGCTLTEDDVEIMFDTEDPMLFTLDKTTVVNGEVITLTGVNFSANHNGAFQIVGVMDGVEQFFPTLTWTSTEIKAVVVGTGGAGHGSYTLGYTKKTTAEMDFENYQSNLSVEIVGLEPGEYRLSSVFLDNTLSVGEIAAFGVQFGSTNINDYTVKLVAHNWQTGGMTEYAVTPTFTAEEFGSMDKISFPIPAGTPEGEYMVLVTYNGNTRVAGWNSALFIF
jgi:hypothetical protein